MKQIKISLPENILEAMWNEALYYGITPNVLARVRLSECYVKDIEAGVSKKKYLVPFKTWRELEAYVAIKRIGDVG